MGIANDWSELMFGLQALNKASAKRLFRQSIRYSWGGMCAYCRKQRATTIDHLKPKAKGGDSLRSNLIPCCVDCNHSKGSNDWQPWFREQDFYEQIAEELIEEWIANKRKDLEDYDSANDRTTLRPAACPV